MKRIKIFISVIFTMLFFVSCAGPAGSQPTEITPSTDIAVHQKKLQETFDAMIICLGQEWNENGGQLLENSTHFKAAVESAFMYKTGMDFPNDNGSVKIDEYARISGWYFPFSKETVRTALEKSYGYNPDTDTVYMSDGLGNVCSAQIVSVEQLDNDMTLKVSYRYGVPDIYDKENDTYDFSEYKTFEMIVRCISDGYLFESNTLIEQ